VKQMDFQNYICMNFAEYCMTEYLSNTFFFHETHN